MADRLTLLVEMTAPTQLHLRVTDGDRELVTATLRDAAADGALSFDELDDRLSAAYSAVTRAELGRLVSDLPTAVARADLDHLVTDHPTLAAAAPAPAAPAAEGQEPSRFWIWALIPLVGAGSWVHAALISRETRYWKLAAVYSLPLFLAMVTAPETGDDLPGWATAICVAFWIVNAIHACTERPAFERRRAARPADR